MNDLNDSILKKVKELNAIYDRVVEVNILLSNYYHIKEKFDSTKKAADIMNYALCPEYNDVLKRGFGIQKEYFEKDKHIYHERLIIAIEKIEKIFWKQFKVLYKTVKNSMPEVK
jgi:hypothetical protein